MRITHRVNLGAGHKPKGGYINVDIQKLPDVEITADFRELSFDNLDKVRAFHLLEHFGREEGEALLRQWYSWLKTGGELSLETPDFEMICKKFNQDKHWMTRHTFGSQENEYSFHKDGWYEEKFRKVLGKIGFEIKDVRRSVSRNILPNIRIVAIKK